MSGFWFVGAAAAAMMLGLGGCATPSDTPHYDTVHLPDVGRLPGTMPPVPLHLRVRDDRPYRDRPLLEALERHLRTGLAHRGFQADTQGKLLELRIEHVFAESKTGFLYYHHWAEIHVRCRSGLPEGEVQLEREYVGRSGVLKGQKAYRHAQEEALTDLLSKVLEDESLMAALLGRTANHHGGMP